MTVGSGTGFDETGAPLAGIIHLDCIFQAAHLLGMCGEALYPRLLLLIIPWTFSTHSMLISM